MDDDVLSKLDFAEIQLGEFAQSLTDYEALKPVRLIAAPLHRPSSLPGLPQPSIDRMWVINPDPPYIREEVRPFPVLPDLPTARPYIQSLEVLPPAILQHRASSVLRTQREALDYLAVRLARLNGAPSDNKAAFPIAETDEKYKAERKRQAKFISERHLTQIDSLKPLMTEDGRLWALHARANQNKHRDPLRVWVGVATLTMGEGFGEMLCWQPRTAFPEFGGTVWYLVPTGDKMKLPELGSTVGFNDGLFRAKDGALTVLREQQAFLRELVATFA